MFRLWKIWLKYQIKIVLSAIPISLIPTFLFWFFGKVVFHFIHNEFTDIWGSCYLLYTSVLWAYNTLLFVGGTAHIIYFHHKLDLSYEDVFDACVKYKFTSEKPTQEWDREWVIKKLAQRRTNKSIVERVMRTSFRQ